MSRGVTAPRSEFPQAVKAIAGTDVSAYADGTEGNCVRGGKCAQFLWVNAAGSVTLVFEGQTSGVLFPAVIAGTWHKMPPFKHISALTTTASCIVGYAWE